jgi:2-polyprenyl-3-methyl-5-hydroxy-6-metoxy-1,4-benzoquinol methylase
MDGGYDEGYKVCPCFWGTEPGSLMQVLASIITDFSGLTVLDAGCGEGKNAAFLAQKGALVTAVDVSELAIAHARAAWPANLPIHFEVNRIESIPITSNRFDVVLLYGLLHCLRDQEVICDTIQRIQDGTKTHGFNILCTFNDRYHDLSAHPGFAPTLLPHALFLKMYEGWTVLHSTDSDLHETHPHNNIPHVHSLTRLVARKD